jgi:REP element-mobilizing transposase RayT
MAHTHPDAQIYCVFSPKERCDSFPDALREKISMYLIGIGHNQSLPILCARATAHRVHLLIAVPRDVTLAQAMLLLQGEFSLWPRKYRFDFVWQDSYS